jgi:hypothetical protein
VHPSLGAFESLENVSEVYKVGHKVVVFFVPLLEL